MNIVFSGCRDFTDYDFLESKLNEILSHRNFKILVGEAKGVDSLVRRYAKEYNIEYQVFKADWDTHGKSAGHKRNKAMVDLADGLIAFWDGKSKGTKSTIDFAKRKGIKVKIVNI